jgi:hypothetical protein
MKSYLAALLLLLVPVQATASPFTNPLTDEKLSSMRGGFTLPGGLQVALGVTTESRIDGQLVLRSTFTLSDGAQSLQVEARSADGSLRKLDGAPGDSFTGPDGTLTLVRKGEATHVVLNGNQLDLTHLAGSRGFGSIVANSADGRSIDVSTVVGLDIRGATPERLGSSLLRVEALALDATAALAR